MKGRRRKGRNESWREGKKNGEKVRGKERRRREREMEIGRGRGRATSGRKGEGGKKRWKRGT